jgi:two-component system, NtrC family, sensor histidine kinase HydH
VGEQSRLKFAWMDLVLIVFLAGLAVLYPISEVHAQLILIAIGLFQVFERRFLSVAGRRGPAYSTLIKIGLSSLLIAHTGGINSSYYLIYYLPVVTAAMYFGPGWTLFWSALSSAAYCSFLIPALQVYMLTVNGAKELAIRNLFFFLAAILVNRFVTENREQSERHRLLAEQLAETNKRLEQAQADARRSERLAALGQLSAGLAHEIRNPLGVIKGAAETLGRKLPAGDATIKELGEYISSEVNRLNSLVSRFLDFARPLRLEKRPEAVPPLIERALTQARERWPASKIEIERNYVDGLPAVPLDAEFAEQVFSNLVFNAYEAMGGQSGKLRITAQPAASHDQEGLEIVFEDSGPGVAAENRERIFNPFFTTKQSGVGLGLSIVSKIMDDHGGSIRIESEPGAGARFRLFFPNT